MISRTGRFISKTINHRGAISLIDQGVVSATNFITGMIIGRVCSKNEFGLYMLGLTTIFMAIDFQAAVITTPYMALSPKMDRPDLALYNGSVLLHQTALGLTLCIILLLAGVTAVLWKGLQGLGTVFFTLSFFGIFLMYRDYIRKILFAQLRMHKALLFDVAISALQLTGLIILSVSGLLSAASTYVVIGSVSGCAAMVWLFTTRREITISFVQTLPDAAKNWKFGKWVLASGLVWTLSMNLYPWFIAAFHGTASTGIWAACMGILAIGNPILFGVQNYLGPRIITVYADNGPYSLKQFILRVSVKFTVILLPVILTLIFFGGSLVALVYGEKYAGNGAVIAILGINLTLAAVIFSCSRALFALERADLDFKINLSALVVMLSIGVWLVYAIGPLGAAIGLFSANAVSASIRWAMFIRLVNNLKAEG